MDREAADLPALSRSGLGRYGISSFGSLACSILTGAARLLLVVPVLLMPWAFGGIHAWSQLVVFISFLLVVVCCLLRVVIGGRRLVIPAVAVPVICSVVFGNLQMLPLDHQIQRLISPHAVTIWQDFADAKWTTLSVYPMATRATVAFLVSVTVVIVGGATLFRSSRSQIWLWAALGINGGVLAFFGLVQQLSWNELLYWSIPRTFGGTAFGPYVCRNNAGGILNLCLAGALGLVFLVFHESETGLLSGTTIRERFRLGIFRISASKLTAVTLCSLITAGILCTFSRGALVGLLGGSIITLLVVLLVRKVQWPFVLLVIVGAAGLWLVTWVGQYALWAKRMETLVDADRLLSDGRLGIWQITFRAGWDYWLVGSGLGTYRYVHQLYEPNWRDVVALHAENQYLQTFVEGGIVGVVLLSSCIVLLIVCIRNLFRSRDHYSFAAGIVGTFALSSQMIHSFFDFGLYLPANALTLALMVGAVAGRRQYVARSSLPDTPPRRAKLCMFTSGCLMAVLLWTGITETQRARELESIRRPSAALERVGGFPLAFPRQDAQLPIFEFDAWLSDYLAVLRNRHDDAEAQNYAASLYLARYEALASTLFALELGERDEPVDVAGLTDLSLLHWLAHDYKRNGNRQGIQSLREHPLIVENLLPAVQHLKRSRLACPILPQVHLRLAQLEFLTDRHDPGCHAERVRRIHPEDPETLFLTGWLDRAAGRVDPGWRAWQQCLEFDDRGEYEKRIIGLASEELEWDEVLDSILPNSPWRLVQIARRHYANGPCADARAAILAKAEKGLEGIEASDAEKHRLRGDFAALRGVVERAIFEYRCAVELEPYNAGYRYELASFLKEQGQLREAWRHAAICSHLEPDLRQYQLLLRAILQTQQASEN